MPRSTLANPYEELTRRERQVLEWVAEGKTNAEIGHILKTRMRTVAKHLEHIFKKLGVERRTAAARIAFEAMAIGGPGPRKPLKESQRNTNY